MIVIPMAGLSSRFNRAGYDKPKYMLPAFGKTLFSHSVTSFSAYFETETFLFIALKTLGIEKFIEKEVYDLGVKHYQIIILDHPTRGQAETVFNGVRKAGVQGDEPLLIFNIDTFRPGFTFPEEFDCSNIDGYLETFIGSGQNWSNVLPVEGSDKVRLTAEKQEISEYCCTGLYYWRKCSDFCRIFESHESDLKFEAGEFYIAPMYNSLIMSSKDVRFTIVAREDVIFCGIPEEYEAFLKSDLDSL